MHLRTRILYFIITEPLVSIFMPADGAASAADVAIQQGYAVKMLRALMLSGPFLGLTFVCNFSLQGMGRGLSSLLLSICRQGFVFLPILVIANATIGLNGIILAQPIADLISVVLALILAEAAKRRAERMQQSLQAKA